MNKKQQREADKATKRAAEKATAKAPAADASMPQAAATKPAKVAKPRPEGALPALPKMPSAARPAKARKQAPCACGCGTLTAGEWAPGHDARARGWAIRIERKVLTLKDVPENEQAGAKLMLKRRADGADKHAPKLVKGKSTEGAAAEPAADKASNE